MHQFRPKSDRYFKSFSSQLDDTLDLLLSQDRDCARVCLVEQELASEQLEVLAGNYLAREALEVDQQTAPLIFNLAEALDQAGSKRLARQLWQKIVDQGSEDVESSILVLG